MFALDILNMHELRGRLAAGEDPLALALEKWRLFAIIDDETWERLHALQLSLATCSLCVVAGDCADCPLLPLGGCHTEWIPASRTECAADMRYAAISMVRKLELAQYIPWPLPIAEPMTKELMFTVMEDGGYDALETSLIKWAALVVYAEAAYKSEEPDYLIRGSTCALCHEGVGCNKCQLSLVGRECEDEWYDVLHTLIEEEGVASFQRAAQAFLIYLLEAAKDLDELALQQEQARHVPTP